MNELEIIKVLESHQREYENIAYLLDKKKLKTIEAVKSFNESHSKFIMKLNRPPEFIKEMTECLLRVLGYQFVDWNKFMSIARNPQVIVDLLSEYDIDQLTEEELKEINQLEEHKSLINDWNKTLGGIANWLFNIKEMKELSENLNKIENKLISTNKELIVQQDLLLEDENIKADIDINTETIKQYLKEGFNIIRAANLSKINIDEIRKATETLCSNIESHLNKGGTNLEEVNSDEDSLSDATVRSPLLASIPFANKNPIYKKSKFYIENSDTLVKIID